jgi:hypothetical protein
MLQAMVTITALLHKTDGFFLLWKKHFYKYKKGLGNAHPDCLKWFLLPSVSDNVILYNLVNCVGCR